MIILKRIKLVAIGLMLTIGIGPATADSISPEVQAALQNTITQQMDAFRSDDGALAYSFAAPSIKRIFPSVDRFMNMVRKGYPQVYRPQAVDFGEAVLDNNKLAQKVFIEGPQGKNWVALYTFEKQADGTYKITGVFLQPGDSTV